MISGSYKKLIASLAGAAFVMLLLSFYVANAQKDGDTFTPPDSEFVMTVERVNGEIILTVSFADSLSFDFASIEREADFDNSFSQCKYIRYDDARASHMVVKRKDTYPYPATSDVLYRLRITSKDGISRIYPPVHLPALKAASTKQ
jgi:hypothetical protein